MSLKLGSKFVFKNKNKQKITEEKTWEIEEADESSYFNLMAISRRKFGERKL